LQEVAINRPKLEEAPRNVKRKLRAPRMRMAAMMNGFALVQANDLGTFVTRNFHETLAYSGFSAEPK